MSIVCVPTGRGQGGGEGLMGEMEREGRGQGGMGREDECTRRSGEEAV